MTTGQEGVDFDKDLKPLLGNPAVISATDVGSFLSDSEEAGFVAALEVKSTDALDSLIEKTKVEEQGEVAGATVYQDEDTFFAVDGDLVVLAGSRELLDAALERADAGEGLSEDDFEAGLEGLPDEALARVYVDVQGLLGESEETAAARKIAWVNALRTLGLTVSAHETSIDIDFNLRTEGDLSDEDLPLAAGDEAAEVVQRRGEIGVGLRDAGQLVTFFESALQAVDPQTFGDYEQGKRAIAGRLDLDVDKDVIAQLAGNLSVSATIDGDFGVRAELKDPAAFARTVDKVAEALPEFGRGHDGEPRRRPLPGPLLGRRHDLVRRGRRCLRALDGPGARTRARRGRARPRRGSRGLAGGEGGCRGHRPPDPGPGRAAVRHPGAGGAGVREAVRRAEGLDRVEHRRAEGQVLADARLMMAAGGSRPRTPADVWPRLVLGAARRPSAHSCPRIAG